MKEELQLKLIERFPFFKPNAYGCNQKRFYFECMDGFFDLIWNTSEEIENVFKKYPICYAESFNVIQVKTKFRELRIYWLFDSDYIKHFDNDTLSLIYSELCEIINRANILSKSLCEICGKNLTDKNVDNSDKWVLKCTDCAKKEKDEKKGSKIQC